MQLGFIGTGTMGNPMARCLLEAGHALTVYDVRREATATLCASGARWVDNPCVVVEASEVVFTSLPGPTEVEQVVLDPTAGLLAGRRSGGAYIDLTTNAPRVVCRLAEDCRARGVEVLDAPVSGRPPGMTIMAGGDAATFATYRPPLACLGRRIFYVGGDGHRLYRQAGDPISGLYDLHRRVGGGNRGREFFLRHRFPAPRVSALSNTAAAILDRPGLAQEAKDNILGNNIARCLRLG